MRVNSLVLYYWKEEDWILIWKLRAFFGHCEVFDWWAHWAPLTSKNPTLGLILALGIFHNIEKSVRYYRKGNMRKPRALLIEKEDTHFHLMWKYRDTSCAVVNRYRIYLECQARQYRVVSLHLSLYCYRPERLSAFSLCVFQRPEMGSSCYILDSVKEFKAITAMLYLLVSIGFNIFHLESFHKGPGFFVTPVSLQQSASAWWFFWVPFLLNKDFSFTFILLKFVFFFCAFGFFHLLRDTLHEIRVFGNIHGVLSRFIFCVLHAVSFIGSLPLFLNTLFGIHLYLWSFCSEEQVKQWCD